MPTTIEIYNGTIFIACPVIRGLELQDGRWELLVRVGENLEYHYT